MLPFRLNYGWIPGEHPLRLLGILLLTFLTGMVHPTSTRSIVPNGHPDQEQQAVFYRFMAPPFPKPARPEVDFSSGQGRVVFSREPQFIATRWSDNRHQHNEPPPRPHLIHTVLNRHQNQASDRPQQPQDTDDLSDQSHRGPAELPRKDQHVVWREWDNADVRANGKNRGQWGATEMDRPTMREHNYLSTPSQETDSGRHVAGSNPDMEDQPWPSVDARRPPQLGPMPQRDIFVDSDESSLWNAPPAELSTVPPWAVAQQQLRNKKKNSVQKTRWPPQPQTVDEKERTSVAEAHWLLTQTDRTSIRSHMSGEEHRPVHWSNGVRFPSRPAPFPVQPTVPPLTQFTAPTPSPIPENGQPIKFEFEKPPTLQEQTEARGVAPTHSFRFHDAPTPSRQPFLNAGADREQNSFWDGKETSAESTTVQVDTLETATIREHDAFPIPPPTGKLSTNLTEPESHRTTWLADQPFKPLLNDPLFPKTMTSLTEPETTTENSRRAESSPHLTRSFRGQSRSTIPQQRLHPPWPHNQPPPDQENLPMSSQNLTALKPVHVIRVNAPTSNRPTVPFFDPSAVPAHIFREASQAQSTHSVDSGMDYFTSSSTESSNALLERKPAAAAGKTPRRLEDFIPPRLNVEDEHLENRFYRNGSHPMHEQRPRTEPERMQPGSVVDTPVVSNTSTENDLTTFEDSEGQNGFVWRDVSNENTTLDYSMSSLEDETASDELTTATPLDEQLPTVNNTATGIQVTTLKILDPTTLPPVITDPPATENVDAIVNDVKEDREQQQGETLQVLSILNLPSKDVNVKANVTDIHSDKAIVALAPREQFPAVIEDATVSLSEQVTMSEASSTTQDDLTSSTVSSVAEIEQSTQTVAETSPATSTTVVTTAEPPDTETTPPSQAPTLVITTKGASAATVRARIRLPLYKPGQSNRPTTITPDEASKASESKPVPLAISTTSLPSTTKRKMLPPFQKVRPPTTRPPETKSSASSPEVTEQSTTSTTTTTTTRRPVNPPRIRMTTRRSRPPPYFTTTDINLLEREEKANTKELIPAQAAYSIIISGVIGGCALIFFAVLASICMCRQKSKRRIVYRPPPPDRNGYAGLRPIGRFR